MRNSIEALARSKQLTIDKPLKKKSNGFSSNSVVSAAACRPPSASLLKSNQATESAKWKGGDPLRAKTPEQKLEKGWKKYVIFTNIQLFVNF